MTGNFTNVYQDEQKSSYQTSSKRLVEFWLMNGQKNPLYYSAPKKDKTKKENTKRNVLTKNKIQENPQADCSVELKPTALESKK